MSFFGPAAAYAATSLSRNDLAEMARNVLKDLGGTNGPFLTFFTAFCLLMGLVLVISGIYGLTKRETSKGGAIATILIGTLLISLDQTLGLFNMTVFNKTAEMSILGDQATGSEKLSAAAQAFVNLAILMVQIVGYVAIYRGLKTLSDVSLTHQRQPEAMRAAIIFIVAGVLCVNILWTLQMVCGTLGGRSKEYYDMLFGHLGK